MTTRKNGTSGKAYEAVIRPITELKPHPQNYRTHPEDQLKHIIESLKKNGFYRNIVISSDDFILAGHGVVAAATALKYSTVPAIQLPFKHDSAAALKVLAGDNEISHLGVIDDRALTEMLKSIAASGAGLLGTGFDEQTLAALAMITRPASEIADMNQAAEWAGAGMPAHVNGTKNFTLVVNFLSVEDRKKFIEKVWGKVQAREYSGGKVASLWWPHVKKDNLMAVQFKEEGVTA